MSNSIWRSLTICAPERSEYPAAVRLTGVGSHLESGLDDTRLYLETVLERVGLDHSDRSRARVDRTGKHVLEMRLGEHGGRRRRHAGDECRSL